MEARKGAIIGLAADSVGRGGGGADLEALLSILNPGDKPFDLCCIEACHANVNIFKGGVNPRVRGSVYYI